MKMRILEFVEGLKVLAIGPHADDIELGCGATLLRLQRKQEAEIFYRVLSTAYVKKITHPTDTFSREDEAKKAAIMLGVKNVETPEIGQPKHFDTQNFPDTQFPENRIHIHRYLEETKEQINPEVIFAPSLDDTHQDHVTVAETVLRVFREGQLILHYEIRQFNSNPFIPNFYVDASQVVEWEDGKQMSFAERKNHILQSSFMSQIDKMYLDEEVILGNMRTRGQQCGRYVQYAEAFQARVSIFAY